MTELKGRGRLEDHMRFRRLRIAVRGTSIEDIDNLNRVSELFHIPQSPNSRLHDSAEGFGYQDRIEKLDTIAKLPGIFSTQTVMFKPLCGSFPADTIPTPEVLPD